MSALTVPQIAVLRANILADPVLAPKCVPAGDGPYDIAAAYNLLKSPTFTVWRTNVSVRETGQAFDGTEWANMTSANHTRLQTVAQYLANYNAALPGIQAMFNDIWGAGATVTKAALLVLWKRPATRIEALFATGTGTDPLPATMVFEGALSVADSIRACGG